MITSKPSTSTSHFQSKMQTTPGKFWVLFGLITVSTLFIWGIYFAGLGYARNSVQTITKDSIPSVVAAQEIRQGFYQMDGDTVANYLQLTHGGKAIYDINKDRIQLGKQLVVAAHNITYDGEEAAIDQMVGRLPMYAELTSPALEGQGNWRARRLLMASDLLHKELIECANQLDKVNREHLTATFNESSGGLGLRAGLEWVLGFGLLGILGFSQLSLAKKTHRWINAPLAIATFLALVMVFANGRVLGFEGKQLKIAKEDAFDSVGFLCEAEADGADARALAMYGLIPEGKDRWQECQAQVAALANGSQAQLQQTYSSAEQPNFKGLLANELRNITFDGEEDAANAELHAFAPFVAEIDEVKSTEDSNGIDAGIQKAFDPQVSIDGTYTAYENLVDATKKLNQEQFEMARDKAFAGLTFPTITLDLFSLAIILLAFFGIRQRVAEYDV